MGQRILILRAAIDRLAAVAATTAMSLISSAEPALAGRGCT
jgi:hypothetical protein